MRRIKLVFLLSFILFSCENEHHLIIKTTDVPLLIKVLIEGESYYEYSYNISGLISEEKSKFHYTKHNYNDKNQLISSDYYYDPAIVSSSSTVYKEAMNRKEWVNPDNTDRSLTKTYEYKNNDQSVRIIYVRPSVNISEYSEFAVENERISRQSIYWHDVLSYYIDYYYDAKGNLLKAEKYHVPSTGIAELWTTNEYEYDDMKNPFQSFKRLMTPGKFTNMNNITKETYTIHFEVDQWIQKVSETYYSYEYNDMGYPLKVNGGTEYVYNR